MSASKSPVLATLCVILTLAAVAGGYLLLTQGRALAEANAKIAGLEQASAARQHANDEALKAVQGQVAGLAANLTQTQNRLAADEEKLRVTTEALPPDLTALATKVTPSVVIVSCANEIGSGFALAMPPDQGYATVIATAAHVVDGCSAQAGPGVTPGSITVNQANQSLPAALKAFDEERDVALLQVGAKVPTLEPATTAPTSGQFVMAVGTPLGNTALTNSVTQGNISKVTGQVFTHTANISSGNSGGPLVDRSGKVVGIVSGAVTPNEQRPVVENLNIAVRLMALCVAAINGDVCTKLN